MLGAVLLLVILTAACVVTLWPNRRRAAQRASGEPGKPGAASAPHPQTLEGVLTLQLVTGEITGPQYRQAMANIAARDAERHPLEVPPEVIPPEAA